MFVSRPFAYGFAVKNSRAQEVNKMFAFIPQLKHVGITAHLAKIVFRSIEQAHLHQREALAADL